MSRSLVSDLSCLAGELVGLHIAVLSLPGGLGAPGCPPVEVRGAGEEVLAGEARAHSKLLLPALLPAIRPGWQDDFLSPFYNLPVPAHWWGAKDLPDLASP